MSVTFPVQSHRLKWEFLGGIQDSLPLAGLYFPGQHHLLWITTSEEAETQLCKITKKATWCKKVTPSMESFFDLIDFDWFESWRPWL